MVYLCNRLFFDSTDVVSDDQMNIKPLSEKYHRIVFIRRDGHIDSELVDMAKKNRLVVTYATTKWSYWFCLGRSSTMVEYK